MFDTWFGANENKRRTKKLVPWSAADLRKMKNHERDSHIIVRMPERYPLPGFCDEPITTYAGRQHSGAQGGLVLGDIRTVGPFCESTPGEILMRRDDVLDDAGLAGIEDGVCG
jgi:hypothetical protein